MESDNDDDNGPSLQPNPLWDSLTAQKFVMSTLSSIYFARESFPADCFRTVSEQQITDPAVNHETLIHSGQPLSSSDSTRNAMLSQNGPMLYFRRSADNPRLENFLRGLLGDGGPLNAIKNQRLAKYQICISASKIWDAQALIEFFSLKFCYSSDGSLLLYIDWGGHRNTPIPTQHVHKLKEFLRTQSPIVGTSYTHCFLSGTNRKPLDEHTVPGLRQSIRQAEKGLDCRIGSWSGRIAKLTCYPRSEADAPRPLLKPKERRPEAAYSAQQLEEDVPSPEINVKPGEFFFEDPTWIASGLSPPSAQRPLRSMQEGKPRPRFERNLAIIEEISDELPPTQILPTRDPNRRRMLSDDDDDEDNEASRLRKRLLRECSADLDDTGDTPRLTQASFMSRSTMRSSRSDVMPRLDASQLAPPSTIPTLSDFSSQVSLTSSMSSQRTFLSPLSTSVPTQVARRRSTRLSAGVGRVNRRPL